MPALTDPAAVRALLELDRRWALYFLGDLSPGAFDLCSWFGARSGAPALAALYRGFDPPVLFALGDPDSLTPLLDEALSDPAIYLHVRPEIVPVIESRYRIREPRREWRMILEPGEFRGAPAAGVSRLGPEDLGAIGELFDDGTAANERPEFFDPSMLESGVYYGIREGRALISLAGTHVLNVEESVAGIGNVYTRRDRRGRGFAAAVTSALVGELLRLQIRTIGLNVSRNNEGAIRIYERLGFHCYCPYFEGVAERMSRS